MSTGSALLTSSFYDGTPSCNVPADNLLRAVIVIGEEGLPVRLVKVIGRGTWSIVFKGEDVCNPGNFYAVKCMALDGMDAQQRESVRSEVELQKACAKATTHVLEIHDDFVENGIQFIVTDLCEELTLLDYINDEEFFDDDERVRRTFVQILDVVEACHKVGISHRDLKPENIFFQDGGKKVILGDFGFASRGEVTRQFFVGTRAYMSPEVLGGFRVQLKSYSTFHADTWSLGVVLMAMTQRTHPWSEASIEGRGYRYSDEPAIDNCFKQYATVDRDYLYNEYSISKEINDILKSIFTLSPHFRISIPELRQRILNVRQFRRTEHAMPMGSAIPELKSAQLFVHATPAPVEADVADHTRSIEAMIERDILKLLSESDITDNVVIIEDDFDSDSASDCESEGPITPETHAIDDAAIAGVGAAVVPEEDIAEIDLGEASIAAYDRFTNKERVRDNVAGISRKVETMRIAKSANHPPPRPKRSPLRALGAARLLGMW